MNTRYDIVIIGGGVTGCATALFLAREPAFDGTILVVERDPTYEHAPSAKATGGFRQQFSTPENIRIGLFGVHFLKHLDTYLSVDGETPDVGFRENGYLLLATEAMLPSMRENNALQRELGADVHFRDPDALRARFPWLGTDGIAGGFLSDSNEGYVDPYSLLQAYRRKARALGVEFVHDEALSVEHEGARVTGVTLARAGAVACGVVVNAAGASGAPEICASVGVEIPIEPRRRFAFVFECREPIGPTPLTITEAGVAFRSEGKGFISNISPPPERDPVTKDTEIEYALFDDLIWPALAARVPAFEAIRQTGFFEDPVPAGHATLAVLDVVVAEHFVHRIPERCLLVHEAASFRDRDDPDPVRRRRARLTEPNRACRAARRGRRPRPAGGGSGRRTAADGARAPAAAAPPPAPADREPRPAHRRTRAPRRRRLRPARRRDEAADDRPLPSVGPDPARPPGVVFEA